MKEQEKADLLKKVEKLKEINADLLKAFVKYGNHRDYCNLSSLIPCIKKNGKEIGCTCGFEAALAKAKKE